MALSRVVSEYSTSNNIATLKSQSRANQGHWKCYYGRLQICRDLENRVRDPSRSLKMPPFDRVHMTSY